MEFERYYRGKNVLVTGGLGFIGSTLSIRLVRLGARVHILNKQPANPKAGAFNISEINGKAKLTYCSMCERRAVEECVEDKQIIFHTAGNASRGDSMLDPVNDLFLNPLSSLHLIEAARKKTPASKIIYTGTRGQYGNPKTTPVDETHPMRPLDINGISKQASEDYFLFYSRLGHIRACCLRLGNVFGPRIQLKNKNQNFISLFIRQALDGECITVFGGGMQKRDFTYIDDLVDALLLCGMKDETTSQVYNVGGEPRTVLEIARTIVSEAKSGSIKPAPYSEYQKKVEVGDFVPDCSKIQALGWKPKVAFEEGLKRTISYYKENKHIYW